MSSTCKPAISTSTTLNQTVLLQFFASSRKLYSLENTLPSKLWPNKFLMSYSGKKFQRCHCDKKLPSLLSSQQHFAGIFASEPMRLSEIDHLSFLTTHAFYIFPPVNGAPLARASRERGAPLSHFYNKFCEIFTLVSSSFHFLLYM